MKTVEMVAGWLLVLAGLSLGLNAVASFDLLGTVFADPGLLNIVHILVGVSAVWMGYKMVEGKKK